MSVKDKAKMFSNNNSDKDLQKGLISQNENKSSSPSIFSKISSFFTNFCNSIKTAFKNLWENKKKSIYNIRSIPIYNFIINYYNYCFFNFKKC